MLQISQYALLTSTLLLSSCTAAPGFMSDHSKARRVPVNGTSKDGFAALSSIYQKHGGTAPLGGGSVQTKEKDVSSSSGSSPQTSSGGNGGGVGQVGSIPADSNSEYLSEITVGGQTFHVNIDTGSSDTWLFSTSLPTNEQSSHSIYDPSKSQTHTYINGASFNIVYGDGSSSSGGIATDTVLIGGIAVSNQAIELPTNITSSIQSDSSDGILGLGFQSLNSICLEGANGNHGSCPSGYNGAPQPTWFENAKKALKSGVFTANLKAKTAGYYNFGSIDQTAAKGDISYVSVDKSSGFWQFPIDGYTIGNGQKSTFNGLPAIADTGSSLIVLDDSVASAYWKSVSGAKHQNAWTFPCDSILPDFTLTIGGNDAVIPGALLNYAPNGDGTCFGGLQSRTGQPHEILGDIFFQAQLGVFDYDNTRFGFAPHA